MAKKETLVALLRGINVTGQKSVPMAALRELAEKLRYERPETYIQSGNLLITTGDAPEDVEAALEKAIARRFGFPVDVMVRSSKDWKRYEKGGPFKDSEKKRPQVVYLATTKRPPVRGAVEELMSRAKGGERVALEKGVLWIDFNEGAGRSKLTPAVLDRVVGSSVTLRNFRTVQKIAEMIHAREA